MENNKITDTAAAGQKKWEKKRKPKEKKDYHTQLKEKEISSKHTNRQYNEQH